MTVEAAPLQHDGGRHRHEQRVGKINKTIPDFAGLDRESCRKELDAYPVGEKYCPESEEPVDEL